jgi:uncharacterized protein YkwD
MDIRFVGSSNSHADPVFNGYMRLRNVCLKALILPAVIAAAALVAAQPQAVAQDQVGTPDMRAAEQQIFALANQARAQAGAGPVHWDPGLAAAALAHCRRMVQEGPISHRYGGEADLGERAAKAGAHFSLVEENVAIGPSGPAIHQEWMNSPGHRTNLLNPDIDSIGEAVIASRGTLYAVADYSRSVQSLTGPQVEERVTSMIRPTGVAILRDASLARAACAMDNGMPRAPGQPQPMFVMRWTDSDVSRLPQALVDKLRTGNYSMAAVGSCSAQDLGGPFTAYRLAVLLY